MKKNKLDHGENNKKSVAIKMLLFILISFLIYFGIKTIIRIHENSQTKEINENTQQKIKNDEDNEIKEEKATIKSIQELDFKDKDGEGKNYVFKYNDKTFEAQYAKNNWKIIDSYKITNEKDMEIICQALINIHPVQGKDGKDCRKVEDMVYEWKLHNTAYNILPETSKWKGNAKDVDFDSADQGRNFEEILKDRLNHLTN